jgi:hypothetical protein
VEQIIVNEQHFGEVKSLAFYECKQVPFALCDTYATYVSKPRKRAQIMHRANKESLVGMSDGDRHI